mmetsp:Transcript_12955/g.35231  ORF Transcript_12955/g.35231 Transcript_12955/m.35231 type:complete len:277 (+) Transcript_12955:438-1268(+)
MATDVPEVELWDREKGQLRGLGGQDVRYPDQQVRGPECRVVCVEVEDRDHRVCRGVGQKVELVLHNERVELILSSVQDVVDVLLLEHRGKILRHEAMVTAVDEELDAAAEQKRFDAQDEPLNIHLLCTGAANGDQYAHTELLLDARNASRAVRGCKLGNVARDPMACVLQVARRDAHVQELGEVGWGLHQVQRTRDQHEILRVVVDDEVDHSFKTARNSNLPDPRMRGDHRPVLRQVCHEGLQLLGQQARQAERVHTTLQKHPGPNLVDDPANVRG